MPIGGPLEHGCGTEQTVFIKGPGLKLQTNGKRTPIPLSMANFRLDFSGKRQSGILAPGEPARNANASVAGEVGGDGVEVFQVHGERVAGFFANFERRIGGGWANDEIDFLESCVIVAADEAADLESLQVVFIRIAGGERIRA